MFKDLSVPTLLSSIQSKYPGTEGWKWNMRGMPNNVGAVRRLAGRDDPEHVSATITSEGTLEFVEERAMSPAEVQMIIRSQGSDAFVLNPLAPSPHRRMENPRLAFGG